MKKLANAFEFYEPIGLTNQRLVSFFMILAWQVYMKPLLKLIWTKPPCFVKFYMNNMLLHALSKTL